MQGFLHCELCGTVTPDYAMSGEYYRCVCGALQKCVCFPAMFSGLRPGERPESRERDGANCFFHAGNKAEVPCDLCGRFLCRVCDIEIEGKHLCTVCIESGPNATPLSSMQTERVLEDSISLGLAVLTPIVFWPLTPITATWTLVRVFRHWNAPQSLVRRGKTRHVFAAILAIGQLGGLLMIAAALAALP